MREIIFRGKRIDNGEWVYGWLRQTGHQDIEKPNGQYIRTEKYYQIQDKEYNSYFVNPETIEQYTGVLDKDGKKIFGGDIAKDDCCIYEVVYVGNGYYAKVNKLLKKCGTQKGLLYDLSGYEDLEIIGNITDNLELLEVEDE